MEQHKPRHQGRLIPDQESLSNRFHVADEVIIQPGNDVFLSSAERSQSFALSLTLRLLSLAFSTFLAWFFMSHYQLSNGHKALDDFFSPVTSFVLSISLLFAVGDMYKWAKHDRQVPIDRLRSNIVRIFWRPVFRYLVWTFLFFVLPFLGYNIFTLVFAAYTIYVKGVLLRLDPERSSGLFSFQNIYMGSTFSRFKR